MGAGLAADGNNDGTVNQADYDLWRSKFRQGRTPPGSGAALAFSTASVPEPASGILLLLGGGKLPANPAAEAFCQPRTAKYRNVPEKTVGN